MKFFLGIPCEKGWMRSEASLSFAANLLYLKDKGFEVDALIIPHESAFNARAIIVEEAQKAGADWLGMMDDDMVLNPETFYQLIQHNVDVVIPLTTSRKHPFELVIYDLVKPKPGMEDLYQYRYQPKTKVRKGLNECQGLGTGVVLFRTSIFTRIMRPWFTVIPPTALEDGRITQATGEDLFFCTRARQFGFKLHYDGDIQVGHVGQNIIALPSLSRQLGTFEMEEANA